MYFAAQADWAIWITVEYSFITITPKLTITRIRSTLYLTSMCQFCLKIICIRLDRMTKKQKTKKKYLHKKYKYEGIMNAIP